MPNPYAPRTTRAAAASFPEGRMRRIGADDDEVATMRTAWEAMTADEQQQAADAIAALTDEELVADLADQRESTVLEALETWAGEQVTAGTFPDANAALDALDLVALLSDEDRAALADPPECLICIQLSDEVRAQLPEHDRTAHVGDGDGGWILDRPVETIEGNPFPDLQWDTAEWWNAMGYTTVARHQGDQVASLDELRAALGADPEAAPGESPEPSTDAATVLEAARGRMTQAPSKILRWVGTDQARAAAVLVLERQADKPRVALTSGAEAILSA